MQFTKAHHWSLTWASLICFVLSPLCHYHPICVCQLGSTLGWGYCLLGRNTYQEERDVRPEDGGSSFSLNVGACLQTAPCHIPESSNIRSRCHENPKSSVNIFQPEVLGSIRRKNTTCWEGLSFILILLSLLALSHLWINAMDEALMNLERKQENKWLIRKYTVTRGMRSQCANPLFRNRCTAAHRCVNSSS
jgi:hypothetical protein